MIYLLHATETTLYKIGYTSANDAAERLKGCQTGCPHVLTLKSTIEGTRKDEKSLHYSLAKCRTVGEWFDLSYSENMANIVAGAFGVVIPTLNTTGSVVYAMGSHKEVNIPSYFAARRALATEWLTENGYCISRVDSITASMSRYRDGPRNWLAIIDRYETPLDYAGLARWGKVFARRVCGDDHSIFAMLQYAEVPDIIALHFCVHIACEYIKGDSGIRDLCAPGTITYVSEFNDSHHNEIGIYTYHLDRILNLLHDFEIQWHHSEQFLKKRQHING